MTDLLIRIALIVGGFGVGLFGLALMIAPHSLLAVTRFAIGGLVKAAAGALAVIGLAFAALAILASHLGG